MRGLEIVAVAKEGGTTWRRDVDAWGRRRGAAWWPPLRYFPAMSQVLSLVPRPPTCVTAVSGGLGLSDFSERVFNWIDEGGSRDFCFSL